MSSSFPQVKRLLRSNQKSKTDRFLMETVDVEKIARMLNALKRQKTKLGGDMSVPLDPTDWRDQEAMEDFSVKEEEVPEKEELNWLQRVAKRPAPPRVVYLDTFSDSLSSDSDEEDIRADRSPCYVCDGDNFGSMSDCMSDFSEKQQAFFDKMEKKEVEMIDLS